MSLAGSFAEQIAMIGWDPVDLTSKQVQAACPKPYSRMYERERSGRVNAKFMCCYHVVWGHFPAWAPSAPP